ncbi:MAG TPA: thrombospondin type 3 repeat-containing protein [Candidatus Polarisedimenticolaceae bacterium]
MIRAIAAFFIALLAAGVADAAWIGTARSGDTAYFLFDSPAEIRRYDLRGRAWLPAKPLAEPPTALAASDGALFVAFGRRVSRFALDVTGEVPIHNTATDVYELAVGPRALYVFSWIVQAVDPSTGALVDEEDFWYSMRGVSIAPTTGRIFGRSTGVSPCDVVRVSLAADGTFVGQTDSPHHGDFPCAGRTFVFPGEARVVDDAGIVYTTNDLRYNNSFAGAFDDLAFYGDVPILLRGGTLTAYTNAFLPTGSFDLPRAAHRIFVEGDTIFSFSDGPGDLGVVTTPVGALSPPEPGLPVDPRGLAYSPDAVHRGADGVIYLLSKSNLSVFRWSIALRDYLATIPLVEAPSHMAYSAEGGRLYLAYPQGAIRTIPVDGPLVESPFANLPQAPLGLSTAGEFVFACDGSGAWATHWTFAPDGALVSQVEWNYYSREYTWSPANRRMYFFRDDTSPNDLHWESIDAGGRITGEGESPYHGEVGTLVPIRVSPDASVVLLGSGQLYDGTTLVHADDLSNNVTDGVWLGGALFTLRFLTPDTQVQRWTGSYLIDGSFRLPGDPIRLFDVGEELLVITRVAGVPQFTFRPGVAGDTDGDGVHDVADNCPRVENGGQEDGDADAVGSACDNCAETSNASQADFDADGRGDACETGRAILDADLSTRVDGVDLAMLGRHFGSPTSGAPYDARVDFDRDGDVDGVDLSLLAAQFGRLVF